MLAMATDVWRAGAAPNSRQASIKYLGRYPGSGELELAVLGAARSLETIRVAHLIDGCLPNASATFRDRIFSETAHAKGATFITPSGVCSGAPVEMTLKPWV